MLYFTSDLHLFHDKEFLYKPRGYNDVLTMSNDLIKNINGVVKQDDILYILGDLVLNNLEDGIILLSQIRCQHIHIILGNHDTDNKIDKYAKLDNVESISFGERLKYGKFNFILSHYPMITGNFNDHKKLNQRVYNLCGHTHTKDKFKEMIAEYYSYHVEVDAHNNKPVSIEEIISDIKYFYALYPEQFKED